MFPAPIPEELVPEGYVVQNIGRIGSENLQVMRPDPKVIVGTTKTVILIQCDDDDLKRLVTNDGRIWLQFLGNVVPQFSIDPV